MSGGYFAINVVFGSFVEESPLEAHLRVGTSLEAAKLGHVCG